MQLMGGLHGARGRREVGGGSPAAVTFHMLRGPGGNWNKCGLKGAQKPRSWGFVCGRGAAAPPPCSGRGGGGIVRGRVFVAVCGCMGVSTGVCVGMPTGVRIARRWYAWGGQGCCGGVAPGVGGKKKKN